MPDNLWIAGMLATLLLGGYFLGFLHGRQSTDHNPDREMVEEKTMKINWTDDMPELSGMGGGYEQTCRDMLDAGLTWLEEHPDADPKFHGWKGIYGVIAEDNEDAKALSKAAVSATDDCTRAMHQCVIGHCMWIKAHSVDEWYTEFRKKREPHDNDKRTS